MAKLGCGAGVLSAGVGVVGLIATGLLYRQYVIVDPGAHIDAEHIRTIISQESPVYYRDGTTRIGVFFEDEHRQYVPYEELPLSWQMGIVAAEDGSFWSHPGLSAKHIARAMRDNVLAGGVVAGGSTLTQQTAKNLYYRPDRSLKSKAQEFLNALRLEAHFDKRQILTWYANQFHVSGNGRGLGIGARYFFDKSPQELEVEEAAFLSGLVKAPSRYDPFLGDAAKRESARAKAHDRTRYVLGRLVDEDIDNLVPPKTDAETQAAYDARVMEAGKIRARARHLLENGFELQFKRGTFRYDSNAVLDEVARRLSEPPFDQVLAHAGIEDPATAGLKVVTTLDPHAQESAIYGLWHHLTEVGTWMEKHTVEDFRGEGHVPFDPDRPLRKREFRKGRVSKVVETPKKHLEIDLGGKSCLVDRDGIVRVAVAIERGRTGNRYEKASTKTTDDVVDGLPVDTVVFVSVRDVPTAGPALCDLELRPELQGALMVLEDGQIRAMVGGNDNRNFNRTTALRQMGSTWKPLVFHAALQLGWTPSDELDNRRNVFPFSTTFYYPRPDHDPADTVSMSWAGVNSENLASVWLLYHLTDRLDSAQVAALAKSLDLARRADEDEKAYRTRIQKLGVLPTKGRVEEGMFLQARQEVARGLERSRHPEDRMAVESMYFGWGFAKERETVEREGGRERATKLAALTNSWQHYLEREESCQTQYALLDSAWKRRALPHPLVVKDLSVMVGEAGIQVACGLVPEGYGPIQETLEDVLTGDLEPGDPGTPEAVEPAPAPAPEPERKGVLPWIRERLREVPTAVNLLPKAGPDIVPFEDVLIEDRVHVSTIRQLDDAFRRHTLTRDLAGDLAGDLYEPEVLYWHQDFRVLLSLRYLESLARSYGVASEVQAVLSLPLGANEITLEEAASVYSGITSGEAWSFPGLAADGSKLDAPPSPALLIAEIRDVDDNVLYRATPEPTPVSKRDSGAMTADILRNVVLHGTGRRAETAVKSGSAAVPLGGKTGTTNDFRNAAFVGFAPHATDTGYSLDDGFIVAAYVGYDDNREMKNGGIKLAGASGALPAWITTIEGMQEGGLLGEAPASAEAVGGAWPLEHPPSLVRIPAMEHTGIASKDAAYDPVGPSILVPLPTIEEVPTVRFTWRDRPVRISPRTDEAQERPLRPRDLWGRKRRDEE
ncbi:MAG: transglycosylase domain-containing protein [Alphaproteobacteria bacterium]|nr:transglycosylase domain-containing protein [Alphaproteobacteria bacterium]